MNPIILIAFVIFINLYANQTFASELNKFHTLYGNSLMSVPTAVRYKFQNETGRVWSSVSKDERYQFLLKYEDVRIQEEIDKNNYIKSLEEKKSIIEQEKDKEEALKKEYLNDKKLRDKKEKIRLDILANEKKDRDNKIREFKKKRARMLKNLKDLQKAHSTK